MADPGNGKPLLRGGGGEQGTGSAEEDSLQFSIPKPIEKISAEGNGTAPAAGSSGVDILGCVVENHGAAIRKLAAQKQPIPLSQFQ